VVQISPELVEMRKDLFMYFQDDSHPPWILVGYTFSANGVMILSNVAEILRFYDFAVLTGKWLFTPILGSFGGF